MTRTAKPFLDDNFLLHSETAVQLYHQYAAVLPIIDYHNHLSPKDIASNRMFNNPTEAWLEGDHYKWRAMRAQGIPERLITGAALPADKFKAWATTVPATLRNPLYHWTHLELRRYFGIDDLLEESNADTIYHRMAAQLTSPGHRVQDLLKRMKVEIICTTDDPADSLEYHIQQASQHNSIRMFPSFRPDKSYTLHDPVGYNDYLNVLSTASGVVIQTLDHLLEALQSRIVFFHRLGCRASDHGLRYVPYDPEAQKKAPAIFKKIRNGHAPGVEEQDQLTSAILLYLGTEYHRMGWVQQFHLGAMRNNNSRSMRLLGADTGFDSIGDYSQAESLSRFLNHLDTTDQLTKTILYNLHPAQNEVFATLAGNFNDGRIPGKMQYGSGWWFLDQKDGMEKQINALSNMGLLSRFVGMVTDSRSFLSFPRHEYFRRVLCNLIGRDVERGELPNDKNLLGRMVADIGHHNAAAYFNFPAESR
jgi:glucuronate isomerase